MMNKMVKVTFNMNGATIEGRVYDQTECGRYIHIETAEDFYCIDTKVEKVEVVVEVVPASHEVTTTTKEAIKEMAKAIKWADEDYSFRIAIQDCEFDKVQSFEIELHGKIEGEFYEGFNFETFGTLKEAMKRAKAIRRTLSKHFEIASEIEVYAC